MSDSVVIRVLVISQVRLLCDGLAEALRARGGFEVIATVDQIAAARSHLILPPPIVLLDLSLLADAGSVRALVQCAPRPKVVAFAVGDVESDILACAEAGLSGYVLRDGSVDELVDTVRRVARDELPCTARTAAMLFRRIGALASERPAAALPDAAPHPAPSDETRFGRLTTRELEIVRLLDAGLSNKEIGARMHIELGTVKNHVHNILEKLEIARRGQAGAAVRHLREARGERQRT